MKQRLILSALIVLLTQSVAWAQPEDPSSEPTTKTLVWPDGTRYVGGVLEGKRSGKGTIFWQDGTRFVGRFENDMRNGPGTMILPDGTVFTGFFKNDELVDTRETLAASQTELSKSENEPVIAQAEVEPEIEATSAIEAVPEKPAAEMPQITEPVVEKTPPANKGSKDSTQITPDNESAVPVKPPEYATQLPEPAPEQPPGVTLPDAITASDIPSADQPGIIDSIESWRSAWSSQDVDAYLDSYAENFATPNNQSRARWEANRKQRLERPSYIRIGVTFQRFERAGPDTIKARFLQSFESNTYADRTLKELRLSRDAGSDQWKIVRERSLRILR